VASDAAATNNVPVMARNVLAAKIAPTVKPRFAPHTMRPTQLLQAQHTLMIEKRKFPPRVFAQFSAACGGADTN
jgi:hypothetical protein